jgi:general secretion pathway protein K
VGKSKGSILILSLWVLLLLGVVTVAVGFQVRQRLRLVERLETREKLRYIAESGVKKAIQVINHKDHAQAAQDAHRDDWSRLAEDAGDTEVGDGFFTATVVDEERKIHLNRQDTPQVLMQLFRDVVPMSQEHAHEIALCILDWRDADDFSYLGGAESGYYRGLDPPYRAKNGDFDVLEELLFVKGVMPEVFARVRPFLTLHGSGKVNVNTASETVLTSLGLAAPLAARVAAYRKGKDGLTGTQDDGVFMSPSGVVRDLESQGPLSQDDKDLLESLILSGLLAVHSTHFAIESEARLKHRKQMLKAYCIFERYERIKHWQERYA